MTHAEAKHELQVWIDTPEHVLMDKRYLTEAVHTAIAALALLEGAEREWQVTTDVTEHDPNAPKSPIYKDIRDVITQISVFESLGFKVATWFRLVTPWQKEEHV